MWKTIDTKILFEHERMVLAEDRVGLPNGKEIKYLKFKGLPNTVTLICRNIKGQILLQKEYSYPPNKILIQFPGGALHKNENPKSGANRELMEETDYKAKKIRLLGKYLVASRRSDSCVYVFLCEDLVEQSLDGDDEEDLENYWVTESEIEKLIEQGKILNSHMLASWTIYKSQK